MIQTDKARQDLYCSLLDKDKKKTENIKMHSNRKQRQVINSSR